MKNEIAKVKYNLVPGGKLPEQGLKDDFGTDLYLRNAVILVPGMVNSTYANTGVRTEFDPDKYGMLISLRSSMSILPISMSNHIGVIEGTYRGEIMIPLRNVLNTSGINNPEPTGSVLLWVEELKKLSKVNVQSLRKELLEEAYTSIREGCRTLGLPEDKLEKMKADGTLPLGTIVIPEGTRVAQAYLSGKHQIYWEESDKLTETERGDLGFGSTNKKER